MATVIPFRGMVYSSARIPDLAPVIAPPYDVIGDEMAVRLRTRDAHNIIHVDLPEGPPPERYAHAADRLRRWTEEGVMARVDRPAIWICSQTHAPRGMEPRTRWGFMARLRIEEDAAGTVLPHENTMDAPRRDRADLTIALKAQTSPIFVLYSDPEGRISGAVERAAQRPPDRHFEDADGIETRVWECPDPGVLHAVCGGLEGHRIWIADGHHRYAAARDARDRLRVDRRAAPGSLSCDHVLACFSNIDSPGVIIRPYHRVARAEATSFEQILAKCSGVFQVKRFSFEARDHRSDQIRRRLRETVSAGRTACAAYAGGGGFAVLVLDPERAAPRMADLPEPLRDLDVSALHRLVLEDAIGIDAASQAQGSGLRFTADMDRAIDWCDGATDQIAFLLHPPDRDRLMAVTASGHRMPQKSTYFYPKVPTGIVINPLEPFDEVHSPAEPGVHRMDR